jgi:hypothetical protein
MASACTHRSSTACADVGEDAHKKLHCTMAAGQRHGQANPCSAAVQGRMLVER